MKQESFTQSLVKLILSSALIVFGGALFGAIMYLAINYSMPVKVPEIVRQPDKEMIKTDAQKYLPKDYSVISGSFLYYEDVDNDKTKEIIVVAKKKDKAAESLFILKKGMIGYGVAKEFSVPDGSFFEEMLVKDINGDKIPEIIYVYAMSAGETMPRTVQIYKWDGVDYTSLLVKNMILPYIARPEIRNWNQEFIRDLKKNGQLEVIIPDIGVYQVYCDDLGQCASLLKFTVYKWDGEKYAEATAEFPEVYDEEIKLTNELLNNSKTSETNKKSIQKYLADIENMKDNNGMIVYRNMDYGFEFKYKNAWQTIGYQPQLRRMVFTINRENPKMISQINFNILNYSEYYSLHGYSQHQLPDEISEINGNKTEIYKYDDRYEITFINAGQYAFDYQELDQNNKKILRKDWMYFDDFNMVLSTFKFIK